MPGNLFLVLSCGHDGSPRCYDDQYVGEKPPGYISYKINTAEVPGKRDLSGYAGSHMLAINALLSSSPPIQSFENAPRDFPYIKSKNSLVKKHLTRNCWDKLKEIKTKTSGFTLWKAIQVSVHFPNQHCGIYAGDWDSYKDFASVFDPIIQEYHGIKPSAKHTSDMDASRIFGNVGSDVPVHSVRIRVGRSIDGFGLSPGITKDQRKGVEALMIKAFYNLTGDLAGTYYPLSGMDEMVRQKLVDDHFLFVSGDRNLQVAGMERDWPEGRGIFHNAAKTFLTWVNEEDQLRIISMQKGGDVKAVFERLSRAIQAVQESVMKESGKNFMLDSKYGYIHSCPTNLGTGMRASVHVDLPGWTKAGLYALNCRCEELHLQPRGTRGESGGQTGITYDISNKHRLGYSEVQLVQKMIDGVNTLWKEDKEILAGKFTPVTPPKAMEAQTNGPFPDIKSKHSLVAKHVTKGVWEKLKGIKTRTSGFTLIQAIACAVEFDNQHCGIYAGDWDSYKDFAPVFDPLIQEYHGISASSKHTSDMDASKIKGNIKDEVPVHSCRIRVGRSIDGFGLSPGITKEQRLGVENLMKNAVRNFPSDLAGSYYPLTGMNESVRQQLVDDHFLFVSGDRNLTVAGMERDWPEGRGIFHNAEKTFLIWVNEEDQLRIISMQKGGDVRGVFERLAKGIKAVGDSVKKESGKVFCLDSKYGYIHSCPTNLGTGMRASVHVDLPGWTAYSVDKLKARCEELHLQPRGTRGESGGQTGHTYDISNKHRLGYSEVQLVQKMIDGVNILWEEDKKYQAQTPKLYKAMEAQTNGPFPNIQSKDSLVAKYVKKDIWEKIKGVKTKTSGFTLIQAIACAVEFDNQHCGIYAGDWDSYKDFAPVFDPLIQEYHGISEDSKHTSDMDATKIKGNIKEEVPVHSCRIRVGRSIDGFGLSPGITKDQRLGVEKLMINAVKNFPSDLAGKYYPLTGMDEGVRQQLVDDHFLFVSGDRNLTVAGMERDWPEGRGIFHNEKKTFLIWVNEEDQLRIISMQKGGDVKGVFERLAKGIKAVGDSVKKESGKEFCLDSKYGYIHSCPTNLGTGMRASVHVDLPGWTAFSVDKLKARCEELHLQPRGTRGESGGQTGHTYDISNKHRLGYSEVELVQKMIDGVNTLWEEDKKYQKESSTQYKAMEAKTNGPFPNIQSKHSLVAKYVTKDVWDKLKGVQTKTSGFTLIQAIACAVEFDNQHCGIYAGDWDSYKDFAPVFDPLIQEYHGISADSKHNSDMDASKIKGNINSDVPVHSCRIRVGRSIDGFGLSPGITKDQRLGVEKLMINAVKNFPSDLAGKYYPLTGMDEGVRQQLVDDHFLFVSGDRNLTVAGMERDWPEGRGIFHNDKKTFLIWVNEEDQLRIISMEKGGDVKGVFERLAKGIEAVGDSVKKESGKEFCLDSKYGYIHSCPTNLGTGMRASVHIDLPGWTAYSVDKLKARCEELHLQPRGTRGESGGQTGHTYDISNKHRLGYSEVQLVQKMIDGVNTLWEEDKDFQKK